MGKVGVLLLGHGSRADGANDGMHRVAEVLRSRGEYDVVEVGFMIRNFPSIEDGAALCVQQGADTVLLIPYFLHTGLHLLEDLPAAVPHLERLHPGVRFVLGQPMGLHPKLVDIVVDRVEECRALVEQGAAAQEEIVGRHGRHGPHPMGSSRRAQPSAFFIVAAARAAAQALKAQRKLWQTEVSLPSGERAAFPVKRCEVGSTRARTAVVIETGDGEDEASQVEVYSEALWQDAPGLTVELGEGIDTLVGPAEQPSLIQGIEKATSGVFGSALSERGVRVAVSVPWVERAGA